jgi:membrane associated rhomboid family serine protease
MLPLDDVDRKIRHFPIASILIVIANAMVFIIELVEGDAFITRWSMVPADIVAGKNLVTIFTAIFMHGGWLHIIGNMVFFWAFAPEIENATGFLRFLIFYLLGGLAATFAQIVIDPTSTIPNLGASGAIAAVMGGFLVTFPRDRIKTLLILGIFIQVTLVPAVILVGAWFILQLLSELGSFASAQGGGGVAYMAHVGGFIFGMITVRIFESRRRRRELGLGS